MYLQKFQTLLGKEIKLQIAKSINQKFQEPKKSHYLVETTQNTQRLKIKKKKNRPLHTSIATALAPGRQYIYIYISFNKYRTSFKKIIKMFIIIKGNPNGYIKVYCRIIKVFHCRLFMLKEYDLPTIQTRIFSTYNNFTTSRTNPNVYGVKFHSLLLHQRSV